MSLKLDYLRLRARDVFPLTNFLEIVSFGALVDLELTWLPQIRKDPQPLLGLEVIEYLPSFSQPPYMSQPASKGGEEKRKDGRKRTGVLANTHVYAPSLR